MPLEINQRSMKTNIEVREDTLKEIILMSKAKNMKTAIDLSIKSYLKFLAQQQLLKLKGKIQWEGDLDEMRRSKYL